MYVVSTTIKFFIYTPTFLYYEDTFYYFTKQNEIAEKRVALSAILMNLLEQQKNRRDQLLETINTIEQQRCINVSMGLYIILLFF